MYYLNVFFIYSILGHLLETIYYPKVNSGILYAYWTPIYGFGVLLILLIYNFIKSKTTNRLKRIILLFIISAISISILEALGGNLIEFCFNKIFWNYEYEKYNFGKYSSLKMSIIWGISSILIIYIINPLLNVIITKIPKWLTLTLCLLLVVDLVCTLIHFRGIRT